VGIAIVLIVPEFLIGLFLDPNDPDRQLILDIGVRLLMLAALFQMTDGLQVIGLGLLRGLQDTRAPMVIAAISYWGIGVTAGYILSQPMGFGASGVWVGLVIGLTCAAVLLNLRFWRLVARRVRVT